MNKLLRLYHTLKYLKVKQFTYRIYYFIRNKIRKLTKHRYPTLVAPLSKPLNFIEHQPFHIYNIYNNNKFTFIGITHEFQEKIDWNYNKYGKLWNYNLTYFDFLQQEDISREDGLKLIQDFINYPEPIRGKKMPFPISLRNINFIKFISKNNIQNEEINSFIFNQYSRLMDNQEYHILGNHLLENGFSLLFGAYYFEDKRLYTKAFEILTKELDEQILDDGAHFELSPMYHQIMLFRVLDCINLVKNSQWKSQELLRFLTQKAELMLGWIQTITYENGDIPLFNDSAKGIAPTSKELSNYAMMLTLEAKQIILSDSGYRKKKNENYECVVDVGNMGPDYILGHAHSDTFNFELRTYTIPLIVDTGLSTYEANHRREIERATFSHNTVEVNGKNQSNVWGGFRVAQRAKVKNLVEKKDFIEATHNGYRNIDTVHKRQFIFEKDKVIIQDTINGNKAKESIAYLHFHPNIIIEEKNNIIDTQYAKVEFIGAIDVQIKEYEYAEEFNKKMQSKYIKIYFNQKLKTKIILKGNLINENN